MAFPVTFVSATSMHLGKTYSDEGVIRPQHAKSLTSTEYNIEPNQEGLETLEELVRQHTNAGDAFFTGRFMEPLTNESRAGKSDIRFKPQVLVLDIDGLPYDEVIKAPVTNETVTQAVEYVRECLPEELANVSCVAHASSSFGIATSKINLHLFFILDKPFTSERMKLWLTQCNFDNETLSDNISLNPSALSLHYPLDRCTGEHTRLIYIAAPKFQSVIHGDPFPDPQDRVCLIPGDTPVASIHEALAQVSAAKIDDVSVAFIHSLRKEQGLRGKTPKTQTTEVRRGEFREILTNPDKVTIEIAYERPPFVYANLNGGDSNAYYWPKEHPKFIYNFKDEPIVEMAKVAPDFYREQLQLAHMGEVAEKTTIPMVVRDRHSDSYIAILYDGEDESLIEANRIQRGAIDDFILQYGGVEPEIIETWTVHFDPKTNVQLDLRNQILNSFLPTEYMTREALPPIVASPGDSDKVLKKQCPNIFVLIKHAIGGTPREMKHFLNWLSFVFNEREKSSVAWIFHGVEGTGKGMLFHEVLTPLFGQYASSKKMSDLEDTFNGWREQSLLVVFDEFRMADAKDGSKTYDRLKNMISEPFGTVRAVFSNQRNVPLHDNFLFFSNSQDAMKLAATDRRFCVATPQHVPLNVVCDTRKLLNGVKNEMDDFGEYIKAFAYCPDTARMIIDTPAKATMRRASQTWIDDFVQAMREGNFEWFVDHVAETVPSDPGAAFLHQRASLALARVASDAHTSGLYTTLIGVSELLHTYQYLSNDTRMTMIAFSKMLSRHGIESTRMRVDGQRMRCVYIDWEFGDTDLSEFVHAHGSPGQKSGTKLTH